MTHSLVSLSGNLSMQGILQKRKIASFNEHMDNFAIMDNNSLKILMDTNSLNSVKGSVNTASVELSEIPFEYTPMDRNAVTNNQTISVSHERTNLDKKSTQFMLTEQDGQEVIEYFETIPGQNENLSNSFCDILLKPSCENSVEAVPKVNLSDEVITNEMTKCISSNNNPSVAVESFVCSYCGDLFPSHTTLSVHQDKFCTSKLINIKLPIESCNFSTILTDKDNKEDNSVKKRDKFKSEEKYKCLVCLFECFSSNDLRNHYLFHSHKELADTLITLSAPTIGIKKQKFITNFIPTKKFSIMDCSENISNKPKLKSKKSTRSIGSGPGCRDPHPCPICKKTLSSRGNLSKHLVQHETVKRWVCDICNIGFNSKRDQYQHHLQNHTNTRPYICHKCGKGFLCKGTLNEHMIFHTQERNYSCEKCGKKFFTLKCVRRHLQRHTSTMKFSCEVCFKKFRVKGDLSVHMKKVHGSIKTKEKIVAVATEAKAFAKDNSCGFLKDSFQKRKGKVVKVMKDKESQPINLNSTIVFKKFSDVFLNGSSTNNVLSNINNVSNIETKTLAQKPVQNMLQRHCKNIESTIVDDQLISEPKGNLLLPPLKESFTVDDTVNKNCTVTALSEALPQQLENVFTDVALKNLPTHSGTTHIASLSDSIPQSYSEHVVNLISLKSDLLQSDTLSSSREGNLLVVRCRSKAETQSSVDPTHFKSHLDSNSVNHDDSDQRVGIDIISETLELENFQEVCIN